MKTVIKNLLKKSLAMQQHQRRWQYEKFYLFFKYIGKQNQPSKNNSSLHCLISTVFQKQN